MKTLAVLLIALTSTAHATVIHLHGTITAVEDVPPIMAEVGDAFTGTFVFNPNRPYDQNFNPLVSFDVQITTVLGTFSYSLEPVYSFYSSGFGPSIAGESKSQDETMFISFLTPNLESFRAGVIFWDGGIGADRLGSVEASAITSIPETASTFGLLLLAAVGMAMLQSYSTAFRQT